MSQTYTPVADCPWVKALEALKTKIADSSLAFSRFCSAVFGKAPVVYARSGTENNAAYWDVPLTDCPAVLLTAVNTPPVRDLGSGNEQWHVSFAVTAKYELRDRDQRKAIAANYDLVRTIAYAYRTGTLDILQGVPNVGAWTIDGDLTPTLAAAGAQTTARTTFVIRFRFHHAFLG